MITLITGNPGAGKTLYAVSKLLRDLVGSEIKSTDSHGATVVTPRVVYTNIHGLLLEHELIDGSENGGLANWHEWAKPGSVICYDEIQREWKPRPNGSKVPKCIEMLETHRHMGVDFIILTQHPGLIDQNIRALVGRHLHVRRFGGVGAAIVYEWDHCSRSLMFSKSLNKSTFRYDKKAFDLYKSAELHTKPKTTIPALAFVVVGAVVAAGFAIPYAASRVADKTAQVEKVTDPKKTNGVQLSHAPTPEKPPAAEPLPPVEVLPVEPSPPFPLDSLKLAGSLRGEGGEPVYMINRNGVFVSHQVLMKAGYAFFPVNDCAVKVTYYSQTHFLLCDAFPPAPARTPAPAGKPVPPEKRLPDLIARIPDMTPDPKTLGWEVPHRGTVSPPPVGSVHMVRHMFPSR